MAKSYTSKELGLFKETIHSVLYKSNDVREMIVGDLSMSPSQQIKKFKEHVKSHLFIDDTIEVAETFIFYDVIFPSIHENIKTCRVLMYVISHRDIIDNYTKEGFHGNRSDILAQMIENAIINDPDVQLSFGIGRLNLISNDIYNSQRFYGRILTFEVPNFR